MGKEIKVRLTVDAAGAVKGSAQAQSALKKTSIEANNASKATQKAGEVNKQMAQTSAKSMTQLSQVFERMGLPIGGFTRALQTGQMATNSLTASTKILRIALIALPFVAIATAVMTLFKAFASTQEGADRLNKVIYPLRAIMQSLWGVLQDLSLAIVDTFTRPQDAVKALWEMIKSQIINRINGVIASFRALGSVIQSALTLDFAGMKEGAKDFGRAYLQALTGSEKSLSDMRQGLIDAFNQGKISARELRAEIERAAQAGRRILEIEKEIEQIRIDQTVPLARMRREMEEFRNLSRDTNATEEERLKNTNQAISLLRGIEKEEQKVLALEIERLKIKQSLNDTSREEQLELQKLIARQEELSARTEQSIGRLVARQASLIGAIDERQRKEEEANRIYIEGLEERANKYRDILLSEAELRERDIQKQVEQIEYLAERQILSADETQAIIAELRKTALEEELEEEQAIREIHAESILALEQKISEVQQAFREAGTQAERDALGERLQMMQDELEERRITTQEQLRIEREKIEQMQEMNARFIGNSIAGEIRRGKTIQDIGKGIITTLLREAVMRVFASVIQALPFPANVLTAPIAAAGVERAARAALPGYAQGGIVGERIQRANGDNRLITARTGEVVLNEQQQQRLGGAKALGNAGVPGFERFAGQEPINVTVDLDDTIRKIEDRQRINQQREIQVL